MARGNDGNLIQHTIESDLAAHLSASDSLNRLWLTCTHSMEPFAPIQHGRFERAARRRRFEYWWQCALLDDEAGPEPNPPVLRAYRHCRQIDRDRYPNSAEIVSALIGRQQLAGTLVELKDVNYQALIERWNGTAVTIKPGSWRQELTDLAAPSELDRPWLFTMDPFTYSEELEHSNGSLYPGDFHRLRAPVRSWLINEQPGVFCAFCYSLTLNRYGAYRRASQSFCNDLNIPNLHLGFVDVKSGSRTHLGVLISCDKQLVEGASARWQSVRDFPL
jgi:hypothetical protein